MLVSLVGPLFLLADGSSIDGLSLGLPLCLAGLPVLDLYLPDLLLVLERLFKLFSERANWIEQHLDAICDIIESSASGIKLSVWNLLEDSWNLS